MSDSGAAAGSRKPALYTLAGIYLLAAVLHLAFPKPFLAITPTWVPWPAQVIRFTGLCEAAGALGLLIPSLRRLAGIMLALYAVCVFPANLNHAFWLGGAHPSAWRWLYHGPRLLLQPVIVWWPLWASGVIDWP
ncbi:MAG: hypothetical protein EOO78_35395, partial [Oxalobacteraceae bacterium]